MPSYYVFLQGKPYLKTNNMYVFLQGKPCLKTNNMHMYVKLPSAWYTLCVLHSFLNTKVLLFLQMTVCSLTLNSYVCFSRTSIDTNFVCVMCVSYGGSVKIVYISFLIDTFFCVGDIYCVCPPMSAQVRLLHFFQRQWTTECSVFLLVTQIVLLCVCVCVILYVFHVMTCVPINDYFLFLTTACNRMVCVFLSMVVCSGIRVSEQKNIVCYCTYAFFFRR